MVRFVAFCILLLILLKKKKCSYLQVDYIDFLPGPVGVAASNIA